MKPDMPSPPASPPPQSGDDRRTELVAGPMPSMTILDGAPVARSLLLTTDGEGLTSGLWDCTAGRFRWAFGTDEIVHVVEGEVSIEDETGGTLVLRPGDVAHFAAGSTTVWSVPSYVKKFYVDRALPADPASRAARLIRRTAARRRR